MFWIDTRRMTYYVSDRIDEGAGDFRNHRLRRSCKRNNRKSAEQGEHSVKGEMTYVNGNLPDFNRGAAVLYH